MELHFAESSDTAAKSFVLQEINICTHRIMAFKTNFTNENTIARKEVYLPDVPGDKERVEVVTKWRHLQ